MRRAARKAVFYEPEGDECTFDIVGESHRKPEIKALLRAGRKRTLLDGEWNILGVRLWLVPEPSNPYDANAVAVATGPDPTRCLQVGHIPRRVAARLQPRLTEPRLIDGVIVGKRDRWGIKLDRPTIDAILVNPDADKPSVSAEITPLFPRGSAYGGAQDRLPDELAAYDPPFEWCEIVKDHKRNGRYPEALVVLEGCMQVEEFRGDGVAPWFYEQAAIIHRKLRDRDAELAVLRRFAAQPHAPGVKPPQLLERLAKLEDASTSA